MSGKLRLGKTADSRTRGKAKATENISKVEQLKEEFSKQKDFTDYLLMKGFSSKTIKSYLQDVDKFLQWTKEQTIPREFIVYGDVLHYIQTMKGKVSQRTISTKVNSLKHYFNHLEGTEELEENPTTQIRIRGVKRKKLYDILTKPELESLYNNFELNEADEKQQNQNWFKASQLVSKRNKVILGLMVYQGLNTNELGELNEKDVKLREGKIYIAGSRRSNERELNLESHQVLDIMEYQLKTRPEILQQSGKESKKLFVSTGTSDKFNNIMQKLMQRLNKQNSKVTSAKQIRTSVITHWLKIHNLRQVQHMAGHRFVSSTEAYLINDLEDLQEDINKYHPIG
jgi:integrase/recombinase XerD